MKIIFLIAQFILLKGTFSGIGGAVSDSSYLLYGATQSITGESKDSMYLEQAGFYTLQTLPPIALQEKKNRELKYAFSCPYPNPSRGAVNLSFSVPKRTHTEIKVYDVTGRVSQILISKEIKPGNYNLRWDIGKILPAGIYFVEMRTKDFRKVHKMILIR